MKQHSNEHVYLYMYLFMLKSTIMTVVYCNVSVFLTWLLLFQHTLDLYVYNS